MQLDRLDVFDFDGTLINVNSFKEINKKLLWALFYKKKSFHAFSDLVKWYILRKIRLISHLAFKQKAVAIFEDNLSEVEKQELVQTVFDRHVNKLIYEKMVRAKNCIISTAAPYSYISRIRFNRDVTVISSLDSNHQLPNMANFGYGKLENIRSVFEGEEIRILNFYTDSYDDQALIDFSINVFLLRKDRLLKIK
jgi:phosphoserine phosphatase